jgi:hypothetical protein
MIGWLKLTDERKRQILNQANAATGRPVHAIEKDWWVTLILQALFSTKWKDNLVFKGGTSLSKAWALIERFSEDIDLAIDRKTLGFPEEFVSKAQVEKLRKKASSFIATEFKEGLEKALLDLGLTANQFKLNVQDTDQEDRDPQVLELIYTSSLDPNPYIADKVLIEIGGRSLREPSSDREIKTMLYEVFPGQPFSGKPFLVPTVNPMRTFLEKAFLLHEEFSKPLGKIRHNRLSRHLYDLEKLMDTEYAAAALADYEFYSSLITHRSQFNAIRGLDYAGHIPDQINFIPPAEIIALWEADYAAMRENMIYGHTHAFDKLMDRLHELLRRFRQILSKKSNIDPQLLQELINDAKQSNLPANAHTEGATVSIRVDRRSDLNKPESEENKHRAYRVVFKRENGDLAFVSINEEK